MLYEYFDNTVLALIFVIRLICHKDAEITNFD